jgi:Icc-related predicted phosphoesterase
MRVVYTADLHGKPDHYTQVLHLAAEHGARAIILGGDLFPNSHVPVQGLILQRDFVYTVFGPWLRRIRAQFRALKVYALLGNEDWASTADLLVDLAAAELFFPLHHRAWPINGGWLAGSSLVPITPFVAKVWDRLEGSEPEPPFPASGGLRSMHGHVHESPAVSGGYADRIGRTLCVNPGQTTERLHAVVFDTRNPSATMNHTVFGALTSTTVSM